MKQIVLAVLLSTAWSVARCADTPQTFHGEISDSACAMNVHSTSGSHAEMLKDKTTGSTPADCVRFCVKNMGSKYVLVTNKKVYHLADDKMAERFAGERVVVRGTLDKKGAIQIASIDKEPAK